MGISAMARRRRCFGESDIVSIHDIVYRKQTNKHSQLYNGVFFRGGSCAEQAQMNESDALGGEWEG